MPVLVITTMFDWSGFVGAPGVTEGVSGSEAGGLGSAEGVPGRLYAGGAAPLSNQMEVPSE